MSAHLPGFAITFLITCAVTGVVIASIHEQDRRSIAVHAARFFAWTVVGIGLLSAVAWLLGWAFIHR
jgi:hypothetical protein